jgi:hypothetical protein
MSSAVQLPLTYGASVFMKNAVGYDGHENIKSYTFYVCIDSALIAVCKTLSLTVTVEVSSEHCTFGHFIPL